MTPALFMLILVGLLLAGRGVSASVRLVRSARTARIAREEGMQFAAVDRFELARRVARALPVPGASEVHVYDVMYRRVEADEQMTPRVGAGAGVAESGKGRLLCVMSVGFTIGTLGHRRHPRRVVAAVDDGGERLQHVWMVPGLASAANYREGLNHLRRALQQGRDTQEAATAGRVGTTGR